MKIASENNDLTIENWIKKRSHRLLTEEEKITLKLILQVDHECKELIRYGKLK